MIFSKSLLTNAVQHSNSALGRQWSEVGNMRNNANAQERLFEALGQLAANEAQIPQDVYRDFDTVTVTEFKADEGDAFLQPLMALSRSVSVGKLVSTYRQASSAGLAQTSMGGQLGVKLDQVEYTYDGVIIPIHDDGFKRNFREIEAMRSEGFDALVDDQRETVRTLKNHIATQFLDGHRDTKGNLIVVEGHSWGGMRNDSRVSQIDLGAGGINFDFTDQTKTFAEIEAAFKEYRDITYIDNNCTKDATIWVSRQIMSNIERNSSESYNSEKIINRLASLMGIASIEVTSELTGNQLMGFPLDGSVRPVVGMAINTTAIPRQLYNADHQFVTWAAIGFQVKVDYKGQTCASYASS